MLEIGRSGMMAQQHRLSRISGNLANVETTGYKRSDVAFAEEIRMAMQSDSVAVAEVPLDQLRGGGGVRALRDLTAVNQGAVMTSPNFFDFSIDGAGYFGVRDQSGALALTRQGGFELQEDGRLVDASGREVILELTTDPKTWKREQLTLAESGELMEKDPSTGNTRFLGTVILFDVPDHGNGLAAIGEGSFRPVNDDMLYTSLETPGAFGTLKSNSLERSNVSLLDEMTQMLMTQRAYQLSTKSVSSADEMMQVVNEIL